MISLNGVDRLPPSLPQNFEEKFWGRGRGVVFSSSKKSFFDFLGEVGRGCGSESIRQNFI
jgi:hypothetical protein